MSAGVPWWWADRACAGAAHLYLGEEVVERGSLGQQAQARAKAVCHGCPVLGDCRDWALGHRPEDIWGVVAGMSWDERRRARRALTREKGVA